jgi:hypothetical protein
MSDKLVFDLAQEVEGSPNVFVRKDWINILDNQNTNYNNNQSVVDTSQLSNSNKYMSYREAYFVVPMTLTLGSTSRTVGAGVNVAGDDGIFAPVTSTRSADMAVGLKNWFGQIIHSFTLDYNGTTVIQQTPFINMWNSFKLMTSLSYGDIIAQGPTIGFYPDTSDTWEFYKPNASSLPSGNGVCNNTNYVVPRKVDAKLNSSAGYGNMGLYERQNVIAFDNNALTQQTGYGNNNTFGELLSGAEQASKDVWKSYIYKKKNATGDTLATGGLIQYAITGVVYLKHIHSFFNMVPLIKGVFMKMTMNLNNTTTELITRATYAADGAGGAISAYGIGCSSVNAPLGGINPVMVASASGVLAGELENGGQGLVPGGVNTGNAGDIAITYRVNLSVGASCLDQQLKQISGYEDSPLAKSIYLYVPAYTFNPVFEQAYLSSPIKEIKYTDVYQYQVLNVPAGNNFNSLLTNGIANVKSVLILPFYSTNATSATTATTVLPSVVNNNNTGFTSGLPVWQSPFDPAGSGPTSPLCWLTNFNVQVSGQNAIYNLQKYNFEQFNNQLYGANAVNGGLTDGITSSLISRKDFDSEYCYYYVNIERMLPVEMSVPKSIQILGQNKSAKALDLYCFVEYGNQISVDILTGARV